MVVALPEYATVREAAEELKVTICRVHQFIGENRLSAIRAGKQLMIRRSELQDFGKMPRKPTGRPPKKKSADPA